MEFEECLDIIDEASTPHEIEFRRYDFRQDMLTGVWYSLQELRLKGLYAGPKVIFACVSPPGTQAALSFERSVKQK